MFFRSKVVKFSMVENYFLESRMFYHGRRISILLFFFLSWFYLLQGYGALIARILCYFSATCFRI